MFTTIFLLLITSTCIIVLVAGQSPGIPIVITTAYPLSYGYTRIFQIPFHFAHFLSIPLFLASTVSTMYSIGRMIKCMAESGYLPKFLTHSRGDNQTPYIALAIGFLGVFVFTLIYYFTMNHYPVIFLALCGFGAFGLYLQYIMIFVTYLYYIQVYTSIPRYLKYTGGVYPAYMGIVVFSILFVSLIILNGPIVFVSFLGFLLVFMIMYIKMIAKQLTYSEHEEKVFFIAYVIKCKLI
jgi:L-asparagine transporter-like permease